MAIGADDDAVHVEDGLELGIVEIEMFVDEFHEEEVALT